MWPGDAIWRDRTGSTLVQVMACRQATPRHFRSQCLPIISAALWHSPKYNFTANAQSICSSYEFANDQFDITATSLKVQIVKASG